MARTGISIQVSNTVLGAPPRVDANSMLIVVGATPTTSGQLAFSYHVPYMLRSADDLETLGITELNNEAVFHQVTDFYTKAGAGTILWLVGSDDGAVGEYLADYVRATVVNGFQYRPRNIIVSEGALNTDGILLQRFGELQNAINELYAEGFSTVCLTDIEPFDGEITASDTEIPDLSGEHAPMVGAVIVTNRQGKRACVGLAGGLMSTLTVGTSIGDMTLPALADSLFITDSVNTPCAKLSLEKVNELGDKQYIFARTRPPMNGLWLNDGATAEEADTALSTLEAGRTIAAMVDELRSFFTPYLNNKIPVNRDGDIQATYKQVVLDNARSVVIVPYIQRGDISDAVIDLKAQNNDMVGTRTWEVTLSIQGAPTLRWIAGFAFYVKSLN